MLSFQADNLHNTKEQCMELRETTWAMPGSKTTVKVHSNWVDMLKQTHTWCYTRSTLIQHTVCSGGQMVVCMESWQFLLQIM